MNSPLIDFRSDTVTRPTATMREAMIDAPVGDDVYKDDPTVNEFESYVATVLGHEASLFMPTGTQSNLVALLAHCQRGDEYIVGADAHTYKYEGGGAAALGGIQPQPVAFGENGELDLEQVKSVLKEDDFHFAKSRLLCLENTQHGRVQSMAYMQNAHQFAQEHGLKIHLDGARVGNAAVYLGVELSEIGQCFDSVSICLSKGLGAPIGSVLVGSLDFIEQAKRWRKVTGGGMRQSGILAAAGMIAITEGLNRLSADHKNARYLANELSNITGVSVRESWTQTNMVWLDFDRPCGEVLKQEALDENILLSAYGHSCRLVIHQDVDEQAIDRLVCFIKAFFTE